ncbi:hypothetical protein [uncultured Draconibacterium sp.]|uniref:hypothetical protein n=1 Tax=uncultured Draconibacterium sp. TaxID=1573823 RepID=UPI00321632A8
MIPRKYINILVLSSAIVILIPIALFISFFSKYNFSPELSDWADFGDYFGGVVSTITSVCSLGILAYITLLVRKQSSDSDKNLYILQKRMDAYEALSLHLHDYNKSFDLLNTIYENVADVQVNKYSKDSLINSLTNIQVEIASFNKITQDFYHFMFHFKLRYSHLFEYDFDSEQYLDLIISVTNYKNGILKLNSILQKQNDMDGIDELKIQRYCENINDSLVSFVNTIRKEIQDREEK